MLQTFYRCKRENEEKNDKKKVRESINVLLSSETSMLFLIKIILFCDDTKLVDKHVLKPLIEAMNEEIMQNKGLLKIFMNIVVPFNPKINNNYEQEILTNKLDSSSKKDDGKRHEELVSYIANDLFNVVNLNAKFFLNDNIYSFLLTDFIGILSLKYEDKLTALLKTISEVLEIDYKNHFDNLQKTLLAERNSQFAISRILKILQAENVNEDILVNFSKSLATLLSKNFDGFLETKAIFIIVRVFECEKNKISFRKRNKKAQASNSRKIKIQRERFSRLFNTC